MRYDLCQICEKPANAQDNVLAYQWGPGLNHNFGKTLALTHVSCLVEVGLVCDKDFCERCFNYDGCEVE